MVWAFAFGTEDVVFPLEDTEKREKTVYVIRQRTTGSGSSLVMFSRNDGKTDSKITMLVHDSKWSLAKANKERSKRKESSGKKKYVYDNFDEYTYRLDETGKVVEGKINFDGVDLDDQIEKNCQ